MKALVLTLLALLGSSMAQVVYDGGRTSFIDSVRWGDGDDSSSSLMVRQTSKFRDSASTWRALSGTDSCSRPVSLGFTTIPNTKLELSYEVRTSSGNTDSSQVKIKIDSRYCRSTDTSRCDSWVPSGRFQGDTTAIIFDSIITVATTSGTTWKPSRQLFDVPGGTQIRLCVDGYKTGAQTNDSTFFRRFVVRPSAIKAGGTPPASVTVSGGGIATGTNQTNGAQKTQIVDGAGNVIGSTSNALNVAITSGSGSGVSAADEGTFTAGTTSQALAGGFYQTTATANALTNGQQGAIQLTAQRAVFSNLRNASGTEIGTSGAPVRTDPTGTTTQPVSGTVTANAGSGTFAVSAASLPLPSGAATAAKQPSLGTAGTASADVITVQGITSMTPLKVDPSGVTSPISAASLPLPSGAATAAKQPALGTAGTASADVLTVQGIASMTALKTDGSAVTQPVSGTVTANAGTGTFTAGGNVASGATDAGNPVKVGGVYNSTPPTLTTGQRGDAQLDANGYLKVNVAAGGASGGTSSSFGSAFPSTGTAVGALNSAGTNMAALNLDASGYLKVNVAAGGGSGGTSSSFGAAVPATGTAAGFSDGTNMQAPRVFDADAGAGTEYAIGVNLRKVASGGSVEAGTSSDPLRVDPTGTTTQPVSAASLPLPSGASTAAKQPALGTAGTASADVITVQGITSMTPLKTDGSGVTQPVSGTVTANAGTGTFTTSGTVTAAATSIGKAEDVASADADVGVPAMAIRKATPANTSGTDGDWEALQMSAGRLWTSSTIDAALPTGSNVIGALSANQSVNVAQINGVTPLMGNGATGTGSQRVTIASDQTAFSVNATATGAAAHDAAVSGNPVLAGAEARTTNGTAVASGDVTRLQATIEGKIVTKPHSVLGATWTYAAASGGITNTTAATMKAAAGAGVRSCLTGIQVINAHATVSTEVVVRDGASGTVLHRGWAQAAGGGYAANFDVPICGTANTLMEVPDITTGAAVYVNAQGYTTAE